MMYMYMCEGAEKIDRSTALYCAGIMCYDDIC
jgi:hypothetical protein